jgi:hypothetical protein
MSGTRPFHHVPAVFLGKLVGVRIPIARNAELELVPFVTDKLHQPIFTDPKVDF